MNIVPTFLVVRVVGAGMPWLRKVQQSSLKTRGGMLPEISGAAHCAPIGAGHSKAERWVSIAGRFESVFTLIAPALCYL